MSKENIGVTMGPSSDIEELEKELAQVQENLETEAFKMAEVLAENKKLNEELAQVKALLLKLKNRDMWTAPKGPQGQGAYCGMPPLVREIDLYFMEQEK